MELSVEMIIVYRKMFKVLVKLVMIGLVGNDEYHLIFYYIFQSILITDCQNQLNQTFLLISNDYTNIAARFINISLTSGYGMLTQCLKITLTFNNRSKWILISEVQFESKPIINPIPLLTTTIDTVHYLDNGTSIVQYWYWLLLASGLLIILIILLIFIYIQWVKTFQQRRKFRK
jgi:hypothetical protein